MSWCRLAAMAAVATAVSGCAQPSRLSAIEYEPPREGDLSGRAPFEGLVTDEAGSLWLPGRDLSVAARLPAEVRALQPPLSADGSLVAVLVGPGGLRVDWFELDGQDPRVVRPRLDGFHDLFFDCGPYLDTESWANGAACTARYRDPAEPDAISDEYFVATDGGVLRLRARLPVERYAAAREPWMRFVGSLRPTAVPGGLSSP
jgi:hypothetical protein